MCVPWSCQQSSCLSGGFDELRERRLTSITPPVDGAMSTNDAAEASAGAARAFSLASLPAFRQASVSALSSLLRVLPRTPAIKFFAPKPLGQRSVLEDYQAGRLHMRCGFIVMSAGASTALFKAHGLVASSSAPPSTRPLLPECLYDLIGGSMGGSVYGLVMAFAPQPHSPPIAARLRSVPVHVCKESVGFGIFFVTHGFLQPRLEHSMRHRQQRLHSVTEPTTPFAATDTVAAATDVAATTAAAATAAAEKSDGLAAQACSIGASTAAGAVAGAGYHAATFPLERAKALAAPDVSVAAVLASIRRQGWAALYRGMARKSLPGFLTGAITFGVYETTLHVFGVR